MDWKTAEPCSRRNNFVFDALLYLKPGMYELRCGAWNKKLGWWSYRLGKSFMISVAFLIQYTSVTVRQTDRRTPPDGQYRAYAQRRAVICVFISAAGIPHCIPARDPQQSSPPQWRRSVVKYGGSGSVRSSHQTVSDYTIRQ